MNKKKVMISASVVAGILLIGLLIWWVTAKNDPQPQKQGGSYRSQLTGQEVSEEEAGRPILGVMIENSEAARPQHGISGAGIVIESVTEGGVTRYLALYQENMPEIVGPVRSLRVHFLDWAMGFDASIAHVGGSPEALDEVENREAKSLNQFRYEEPYYRDNDRAAPHNMFARTEGLRELQKDQDHKMSEFSQIPRSGSPTVQTSEDAQNISIDFSQPPFAVEFRYDTTTGTYTRYLAGEPHTDAGGNKPITVQNVIVLRTESMDGNIQATGSGDALVFRNGKIIKGTWNKESYEERFKITDENDEEISLSRGATWVAALPDNRSVTY